MKKLPLTLFTLLLASLPVAQATSVIFSGAPLARLVVNSNSATLTSGLVWAGTFSSTGFGLNNTLSLAANVASVTSSGGWKQFTLDPFSGFEDEGVTNTLKVSPTGKVGGNLVDIENGASYFNNKPIYLWIFNGASVSTSTEMGIFRATTADTPWTFPVNAGGVGDTLTLSTVNTLSTIAAFGGFGSTPSGKLQLTNNFNVAPVPEPATLTVGIFAGMACICVRRRRN